MTWPAIAGIGLLAGIGFTMSLFIAHLAFPEQELLYQAKLGVLTASVVASLAGLAFLARALPQRRARRPSGRAAVTAGRAQTSALTPERRGRPALTGIRSGRIDSPAAQGSGRRGRFCRRSRYA